jgi:hypothetical protein
MLLKISPTKAFRIELIRMETKGPVYLSIRQMYATKKNPDYKPGRQGLTIPVEDGEARKVIKGLIKTLKNEKGVKPKLVERKEKE